MIHLEDTVLSRTPKRSALIWRYLPAAPVGAAAHIGVLVPYGTAYFRYFQTCLFNYLARVQPLVPNGDDKRATRLPSWLDFRQVHPRLIRLNTTATAIWERCDGRRSIDSLVAELTRSNHVSAGQIQTEVLTFVRAAHAQGILNLDFPHPPAEGYPAIVRRELERGTLWQLVCDASYAPEIEHMLNDHAGRR